MNASSRESRCRNTSSIPATRRTNVQMTSCYWRSSLAIFITLIYSHFMYSDLISILPILTYTILINLFQLKSKAKLNKFVQIKTLPKKNENVPANQKCSIAGWGRTHQDSAASNVLQEVTLKVQFNFECRNIWKDRFSTDSMICTVSDGKKAFCQVLAWGIQLKQAISK